MRSLRALSVPGLAVTTLPTIFGAAGGPAALAPAVNALCRDAADAVRAGCGILILSDCGVDAEHAPIPSLLAVAAVHHHLIRERLRARVSLLAETAVARGGAHFGLHVGYVAGAVHLYLALVIVRNRV